MKFWVRVKLAYISKLNAAMFWVIAPIYYNIINFLIKKGLFTADEWNEYILKQREKYKEDLWLDEQLKKMNL